MKATLSCLLLVYTLIFNARFGSLQQPLLRQLKHFPNMVVELNEQVMIPLNDYYSGPLINYHLTIKDAEGIVKDDEDIQQLINITESFQLLVSESIKDKYDAQLSDVPFPRSSIFVEEEYENKMSMYIVDRRFMFMRYDATQFSQQVITKIYEVQLDTQLINQRCSDLNLIKSEVKYLLLFCQSQVETSEGHLTTQYTVAKFQLYNQDIKPRVQYLTYFQQQEHPSLDFGLEWLGFENLQDLSNIEGLVFMSKQLISTGSKSEEKICITRFSTIYFLTMDQQGLERLMLPNGQTPFYVMNTIKFRKDISENNIIDFMYVDTINQVVGFLIEDIGFYSCNLNDTVLIGIPEYAPDCAYAQNTQMILLANVVSLYLNPEDYNRLWISSSMPAGIYELDISDPVSYQLHKKYFANIQSVQYIGRSTLASNNNYIFQLVEHIVTKELYIRAYNRHSTFFNSARVDYKLPDQSKPNFYAFPNYFLNILWFRDEQTVNATAFLDPQLRINARNKDLLAKYQQQNLELSLKASIFSDSSHLISVFYVLLVSDQDTSINSVGTSIAASQLVFYNCGQTNFQYRIQDQFNGPNYELQLFSPASDCSDGSCFFKFINKKFTLRSNRLFDFSQCTDSYIFPYIQAEYSDNEDENMVLVCIDKQNATLVSYVINSGYIQSIYESSRINIPNFTIKEIGYDYDNQLLFIIGRNENQNWIESQMEAYFFLVYNQLLWQLQDSESMKWTNFEDISSFSYNPISKMLVFTDSRYLDQCIQNMNIINLDITSLSFDYQIQYQMALCNNQKVLRAMFSDGEVIFTIQANNVVNTYLLIATPYLDVSVKPFHLSLMQSKQFPTDINIHSLDIFDSKYFILYYDDNIIEVYTIEMQIYLVYKMRLPLYIYSDYGFNPDIGRHCKTYFNGYLGLILTKDDKAQLIIYELATLQHNSFTITLDVSNFLKAKSIKSIFMTGKGLLRKMILVSDKVYQQYNVILHNHIALADLFYYTAAIKNCTSAKIASTDGDSLFSGTQTMANLNMVPISFFHKNISNSGDLDFKEEVFQIRVETQNQGFALTRASDKEVSIAFSHDFYVADVPGKLLSQDLVEGFNVNYQFQCSYHDDEGNIKDCTNEVIDDQSQTIPFYFYIEYVTIERTITHSFTAGNFLIMLDSMFFITFQRIPDISLQSILQPQDSTYVNKALEQVYSYSQEELLKCVISDFAKLFYVRQTRTLKNHQFFLIYQCAQTQNVQIGSILLKNDKKTIQMQESKNYEGENVIQPLVVYRGSLKISQKIIDLQYLNSTSQTLNEDTIRANIIITSEIDGSYQNKLELYSMTIDLKKQKFGTVYLDDSWYSIADAMDSFKVTDILAIQESQLFLVVDKYKGFYIFDSKNLLDFDAFILSYSNIFDLQNQLEYGKFEVYQIIADLSHTIHVLTNYGIFVYVFNASLTDRDQLVPNIKDKNKIVESRVIRMSFDYFNQEVASNKYGYAFLVTKETGRSSYEIHVGAVSFFSSLNSQIFKTVFISRNQQCQCLNQISSDNQTVNEDLLIISINMHETSYLIQNGKIENQADKSK